MNNTLVSFFDVASAMRYQRDMLFTGTSVPGGSIQGRVRSMFAAGRNHTSWNLIVTETGEEMTQHAFTWYETNVNPALIIREV